METKTHYGDEGIGYNILARDMSPIGAQHYLIETKNDGLIEKMNQDRLKALKIRAGEKK